MMPQRTAPVLTLAVSAAKVREYGNGLKDGIEIALTLALGESTDGGDPYAGPIPPEFEAWAREALRRVQS